MENTNILELKIDDHTYKVHRLGTKDRYDLMMNCLSSLSVVASSFKQVEKTTSYKLENKDKDIDAIIDKIINKLDFDTVSYFVKKCSENNFGIDEKKLNEMSVLTIIELFVHIIKHNCLSEILKKDIGGVIERVVGSSHSLVEWLKKVQLTPQ
jgi:hypothetical protein